MRNARRSEDTEQITVISWAKRNEYRYPELKWLHHIPNGGSRNEREAVKLKQMGVKPGVSDLCLPYPRGAYSGLYIEMKYNKGKLQQSQKDFLADMELAGHYVAVCYSAVEAINIIEEYINLKSKTITVAENNKSIWAKSTAEVMDNPNNSIYKNGEVIQYRERENNDE